MVREIWVWVRIFRMEEGEFESRVAGLWFWCSGERSVFLFEIGRRVWLERLILGEEVGVRLKGKDFVER